MNNVYLCLGGNIGHRETSIQLALSKIQTQVGEITAVSSIYETEAWGVHNQQAYLNLCLCVKTHLQSDKLLNMLLNIEQDLGRERNINHSYEPRTIDIDILFFNDDIVNEKNLIIPHPRLHLRKFVLIPLHEIHPNYLHPVLNKTIFNLLQECKDASEVQLFKINS